MTLREYIENYFGDEKQYLEGSELNESALNKVMDYWEVVNVWAYNDSPNAGAYRLLESYGLNAPVDRQRAIGEIRFIDGACPGNDYLGVEVADVISLGLLQKHLNDLDTGIRIVMS